jgi:hypothetical protein
MIVLCLREALRVFGPLRCFAKVLVTVASLQQFPSRLTA